MHFYVCVFLSWSSIVVKRHHDHSNSYKGKHLVGAGLQLRPLVHYHHGWKRTHGAGEGLRVLDLDWRHQEERDTGSGLSI